MRSIDAALTRFFDFFLDAVKYPAGRTHFAKWLSTRKKLSSVQSTTKNFFIDNHYKTIKNRQK